MFFFKADFQSFLCVSFGFESNICGRMSEGRVLCFILEYFERLETRLILLLPAIASWHVAFLFIHLKAGNISLVFLNCEATCDGV